MAQKQANRVFVMGQDGLLKVRQKSEVISEQEIKIVHAFAGALSQIARLRIFATFMEEDAVHALLIHLHVDLGSEPETLGIVAVVLQPDQEPTVLIRGPNNLVLPGPESYPSVVHALVANKHVFAHLAKQTRKRFNPTLTDRLLRVFD